ncbi:MAG: transglutaminase domain-containing protein [Clostridia bacterium]|nr:transglutaminase domain-containing protein [Clostridia bacterium]MBR0407993.1 transglutaminase domain-containing protein [Clostridia bacterium]
MPDRYLESQVYPLPQDIARLIGAGEFDLALKLIARRLREPLPAALRARLEAEQKLLPCLPHTYTLSHEDLLRELQERVKDFTARELDELLLNGKLDFIYINGERRYFNRMASSLIKSQPQLKKRTVSQGVDSNTLNSMIQRMKEGDVVFRYRLQAEVKFDASLAGKTCRVHLPLAARSMQQEAATDVECSLPILHVDPEDAPQRTAYIETDGASFTLSYTVTQRAKYIDPLDESIHTILYPDALPVSPEDLIEQPPHLTFTPYIKALAEELRGEETDPVRVAWRFYDYITKNVIYSFMPPYRIMPSGAEYVAVNLRGDCGMQTLLFMALCRVSGIPARWQSGLAAEPGDVGSHDWAEFYSERLGWLPVDCSYGGGANRVENEIRRRFYFGNLDPFRMVANRTYYAPLTPEKKYPRIDPYDSQSGEAETDDHGLTDDEFDTEYTMLWHEITDAI